MTDSRPPRPPHAPATTPSGYRWTGDGGPELLPGLWPLPAGRHKAAIHGHRLVFLVIRTPAGSRPGGTLTAPIDFDSDPERRALLVPDLMVTRMLSLVGAALFQAVGEVWLCHDATGGSVWLGTTRRLPRGFTLQHLLELAEPMNGRDGRPAVSQAEWPFDYSWPAPGGGPLSVAAELPRDVRDQLADTHDPALAELAAHDAAAGG